MNCVIFFIVAFIDALTAQVETTGEKALQACKSYGQTMLECHNVLYPTARIRVPIDLLLYPHMTLIGFRKLETELPTWKCGGSLLSNKWILTAAHCKEDPISGPASVLRIGTATFEFDEVEGLAQERDVAEIVAHPNYKPPSKYHDIALMRAHLDFILSRNIRIACLPTGAERLEHEKMTVIGFGTTVSGVATSSQTLMGVDVDFIDSKLCNRSMRSLIRMKILMHGITDDQLCAGDYQNGGRDTCQGDSGGPLQIMVGRVDCVNSFPLHKVVGVTSFGRDCGRKMAPGVYTRVSRYVGWIESKVWP